MVKFQISIDKAVLKTEEEAAACCADLTSFFQAGGTGWQGLDIWIYRLWGRVELVINEVIFKTKAEAEACLNDLKGFFETGGTAWQSLDVWMTVDQVYEGRWDCPTVPEGVRLQLKI